MKNAIVVIMNMPRSAAGMYFHPSFDSSGTNMNNRAKAPPGG